MAKILKGTQPFAVGVAKGKFHGEEIILQVSLWDNPQTGTGSDEKVEGE